MTSNNRNQKSNKATKPVSKAANDVLPLSIEVVKKQLAKRPGNKNKSLSSSTDKQLQRPNKGFLSINLPKHLPKEVDEVKEVQMRKKQLESTANPSPKNPTPDCFPPQLYNLVMALAALSNSYTSYSAVCVYMLLSNLLSRFFTIQPDSGNPNYIVSPNQSGILIGPPSIKKSPVLNSILKPVYEFLERMATMHRPSAVDIKLQNRKKSYYLKKADKKLQEALDLREENPIASEKLENEAKELIRLADPISEYDKHKHLVVSNCTAMGLATVVDDSEMPLLVVQDELGNLLKETLSAGNKTKELLIGLMDGMSPENYVNANRVYETRNKKVSIIGATPTETLNAFKHAVNDGFIMRFTLVALPDQKAIKSKEIQNTVINSGLSGWNQLIGNLVTQIPSELTTIKLSAKAEEKLDSINDVYEQRIASDNTVQKIKSLLGKRPSFVASIALVNAFARYEFDLEKLTKGKVMQQDIDLASKYAEVTESHFAVAFGVHSNIEEQQALELLNRITESRFATEVFTASQIAKNEWSGFKDPKFVESLLLVLREYALVRIVSNSSSSNKGGRPTRKWAVVSELVEV
ncbi:DUF3987 domain-containing protein [Rheinheimera salexigens]|uniref:DUF3987 domain-containing protein n=1 Tax=Rheinheimera salexigens TaxID=1628148 RepID=A0A1E7Q784_9GAMM|nr:DUF3987 domain-containing protein [Rheinheimera salexigens]OEY70045.1 hypothetical protein BI198_11045 [Rheinheimera salexigens]